MKITTEDGVEVESGTLIFYVNYLGHIVPTILKKKTKATVKYFSTQAKAEEYHKSGLWRTLSS